MLATIISTSGSTPASALSKMLVKQDAVVSVGTVGGGCMEGEVILHANRLYRENRAEVVTFHLNEDDIEHGLICGGSLDVLIEPLTKEHIPLLEEMRSIVDEGEDCLLGTLLSKEGTVGGKWLLRPAAMHPAGKGTGPGVREEVFAHVTGSKEEFAGAVERAYRRQETQRIASPEGELILEPVAGCPSLLIFGGGHVSKSICRLAAEAGFRVTVIDDREKFANRRRFPAAAEVLVADFRDAFNSIVIKPSTYVVIVTRGHRYDEEVLAKVVRTPARYIGMIGSERKVLTAFGHLSQSGVPKEEIGRIHAPIGIEIGAVTPEEIAVSIVAQLVRTRRSPAAPLRDKSAGVPGW